MERGAWLRGLGWAQYEQAFRDNDVDARGPAGADRRQTSIGLGVTSIGHRRRAARAIAALRKRRRPTPVIPRRRRQRNPPRRRRGEPVPAPQGRAAAAHGDVRRPRRLDRAVRAARSRGHARGDPRLPGRVRARSSPLRRPRRQVHGRRRARLFRLAAGARGRRRAGGARRPRRSSRRSAGCAAPASRSQARDRHRDRAGRGRRPDRRGRRRRSEAVVGETPNLAARLQALAEPGRS